jgi:hypothetical protein
MFMTVRFDSTTITKVFIMTMEFPNPASPTVTLPAIPSLNPNGAPILPPWAGFPIASSLAQLGWTIGQAIAQGALPPQAQVLTYTPTGGVAQSFAAWLNPTVASLASAGVLPLSALLNTLAFSSPSANYGGN